MQDLATVLAWCRAQEDVREVNLVAQDTAGYQALVARPVLEGLARTVIELAALPEVSGEREVRVWPATLDLPGLEQFGGPRAAAALSAPAPLWLYGNLSALDPSWARVRLRARRRGLRCCDSTDHVAGPRRDRALDRSRRIMVG